MIKEIRTINDFRKLPIGTIISSISDMGSLIHLKIGRDKTLVIENTMINLYIGEETNMVHECLERHKKGQWVTRNDKHHSSFFNNLFLDSKIQKRYEVS